MTSQELVYKPPVPAPSVETVTPVESARPSGPAAAVVLSAALGCLTLGVLSVLTAAEERFSDALTVSDRVGDISGITTAFRGRVLRLLGRLCRRLAASRPVPGARRRRGGAADRARGARDVPAVLQPLRLTAEKQ